MSIRCSMTNRRRRSLEGRRLLVTGATGFAGRNLVGRLVSLGAQVGALTRCGSRAEALLGAHPGVVALPAQGDAMRAAVAAFRPEGLFHLAAHRGAADAWSARDAAAFNVLWAIEIVEAAMAAGCRLLVDVGTQSQHRTGCPDYAPTDFYAASKQAFQDFLVAYRECAGLRAVTLKLSDTYGPGDDRGRLLQRLLGAQASGAAIDLTPGEQRIDLVHVEDVVAALIRAFHALESGAALGASHAVRTGRPLSLRALVGLVEALGGRRIDARWGAIPYRPGTIMSPWAQPTLPGWRAQIALEDGLRQLIDATAREAA